MLPSTLHLILIRGTRAFRLNSTVHDTATRRRQSDQQQEVNIAMQQAFGIIDGPTGNVLSGSGNFTIEKEAPGQYLITLQGASSDYPVVAATPQSAYKTAVLTVANVNNGSDPNFNIFTSYSDQGGSTSYQDLDYFHFFAFWN
jgi:hypothetical protein